MEEGVPKNAAVSLRVGRLSALASVPRLVRIELLVLAAVVLCGELAASYRWAVEHGADAQTYLAAADRLNIGHQLYALSPGDWPVPITPPFWTVPLLSPPLVAVLWRPIALLPDQWPLAIWYAGAWVAILGSVAFVARHGGLVAAGALFLLSAPLGDALGSANVNAYLVAGILVVWLASDDDRVGILVGLMAAIKIWPILLGVWLFRGRRWRALAYVAIGLAVGVSIGVMGAGLDVTVQYVGIARDIAPSPMSISGITGVGSASLIAAVLGVIGALLTRGRLSFVIASLTMVLGSPVLYSSGLVVLLPAVLPANALLQEARDHLVSARTAH